MRPDALEIIPPEETLMAGGTLRKIETDYHTAVSVQKPRDLDKCLSDSLKEADFGGELFYYSWLVTDRKTGEQKLIEDLGIDGALTIARNWTNCACPMEVSEAGGKWIFRASFVDLEKGFTLSRLFEKSKPKTVGKWDIDRWSDMQFQAAQSRAQRGVILKAMPVWLTQQVLERSKQAALKGIGKMGLSVSKKKVLEFFKRYGLERAQLEKYVKKDFDQWQPDDVLALRSAVKMIQDKAETVESLFGEVIQSEQRDEAAEAIKAFWEALKTVGITSTDKNLYSYLKEISEFMGESIDEVMVRSGRAFYQDGELVESELDEFMNSFNKRFPKEKKRGPGRPPKKQDDDQKGMFEEEK